MSLSRWPIGIAGGLLLALVLAPATGTALGQLAEARRDHARLAALAAAPAAPLPVTAAGLAIEAPDPRAARAAMEVRLQTLAKAGGVLVEETRPVAVPAGLVGLRLRVSGAEKAVIALGDAFERARPAMRLRNWRVEPMPGGGVRLTGEAVAAWQ